MAPRTVLLAVWALAAACSGQHSFEVYCRNSGDCACADGECCALEGRSCDDLECCGGAACVSGLCVVSDRFRLTPAELQFGPVSSPPSAPQWLTVTNTSARAAPVLATLDGEYAMDASECAGSLAPGASCRIQVQFVGPSIQVALNGTVWVADAEPKGVMLSAKTARRLTVSVSGPMSVASSPPGIQCPGQCSGVFPLTENVALLPSSVPFGYWMNSMDLYCDPVTGRCTCEAWTETARFAARTNLMVRCVGGGSLWLGNEELCSSPATAWDDGGKAMVGTAVLEARHEVAGSTNIEWTGECQGTQGMTCTTEVSGATWVMVRFQ